DGEEVGIRQVEVRGHCILPFRLDLLPCSSHRRDRAIPARPDAKRRVAGMWFVKIVLVLVVVYAVVAALMYGAQTRLLFPTRLAAGSEPLLPAASERVEVVVPDGTRLRGVRIPPSHPRTGERLILLGFGGNAWNADNVALYLHGLFPEAEAVAFHYRGYLPSEGRPSAAALLADAPSLYDHIVGAGEESLRIVAVGFSIGTGVAAAVARHRPLAGLILVSPFDSLRAVAADLYPWLPVRWLLRHRMPTAELLRGLDVPTAVIAAERDSIVPPRRTAALRSSIRNLVFDRTIPGAGHNDLYGRAAFGAAMTEALQRVEAAPALG
ncbi:MAG TPA: hypothetical protein VIR38_13095, partial [Thalassobaculum sp.]